MTAVEITDEASDSAEHGLRGALWNLADELKRQGNPAEAALVELLDADLRDSKQHVRDAVMELARPMPTREQIAEALSSATRDMDYKRWETPQGMLPFADAVLALLNGTPAVPACLGDGVCTNPRCPTHGTES